MEKKKYVFCKENKHCLCSPRSDQFEKIKKFYQESLKAEERSNSSVSGPLSPVEQSKKTRSLTEDQLEANKDKFLRALAAQNKSLSKLQQNADDVDKKVQLLSDKVGSSHSALSRCIKVVF